MPAPVGDAATEATFALITGCWGSGTCEAAFSPGARTASVLTPVCAATAAASVTGCLAGGLKADTAIVPAPDCAAGVLAAGCLPDLAPAAAAFAPAADLSPELGPACNAAVALAPIADVVSVLGLAGDASAVVLATDCVTAGSGEAVTICRLESCTALGGAPTNAAAGAGMVAAVSVAGTESKLVEAKASKLEPACDVAAGTPATD